MNSSELRSRLGNHPTALEYLDGRQDYGNWLPTALVTVAYACMSKGIDYAGYLILINDSELTSDPKQAQKVSRMVQGRWDFAEEHFEEGSIDLVRDAASDLHERIFWTHFPSGQKGLSQRLVALAFARHAVRHGAYTFNASVRYLSQESGVSDIEVVSKVNRALQEAGLIELIGQNAYGYRFKLDLRWLPPASGVLKVELPQNRTNNLVHHIVCTELEQFGYLYAHDVFLKDGLGPVAGFVLSACPPGAEVKSDDLANALGLGKSSIRNAVKVLVENSLATPVRGGLVAHEVTTNDLDLLALKLGCGNWREKQRDKHAPEQARHAKNREVALSERLQKADEQLAVIESAHMQAAAAHQSFLDENVPHRDMIVEWGSVAVCPTDPFLGETGPLRIPAMSDPFAA